MTSAKWATEKIWTDDNQEVDAVCPVIISASRATDIPAFFSKWFFNRLRSGYLKWVNPFNSNQVQFISFSKARVIVFWTKNPKPMLDQLSDYDNFGINYYFQFTVNNYPKVLEPKVPPLASRVETFRRLSEMIGRDRVIWRFDPLMLTPDISLGELTDRLFEVGDQLYEFTDRLVISFADIGHYRKVSHKVKKALHVESPGSSELSHENILEVARRLQEKNRHWKLKIGTCTESVDLDQFGIEHNRCIDDRLMVDLFSSDSELMKFLGYEPSLFGSSEHQPVYLKDKGQRKECGCIASKDIGMYDTCPYDCTYCYAVSSSPAVARNLKNHDISLDVIAPR